VRGGQGEGGEGGVGEGGGIGLLGCNYGLRGCLDEL